MEIVKVQKNEQEHLVHFTVNADQKAWTKAQENALKFLATKMKLKGFRTGKVPPEIAIKYINKQSLIQRALEKELSLIYKEVINYDQWDTHDVIEDVYDVNVIKADEQNLELEFKFAISPKVKLFDYKKLKIDYLEPTVTDQEIDNQLQMLVKAKTNIKPVIDPNVGIELNDRITIDFNATIDNKPFSGSEGKNYQLIITKDEMVPGFNNHILGAKVNEIKEFDVVFPNDYFDNEVASKKAHYHVQIKKIDKVEKLQITDEIVKKLNLPNINTVAGLRNYFKIFLTKQKKQLEFNKTRDQIVKLIIDQCTLDYVPTKILNQQKQYFLMQTNQIAQERNLSLEEYAKQEATIGSIDKLNELIELQAKNNIILMFTIDQLTEQLKIEVTDNDIEKAYEELSLMQQKPLEEIKKLYRDKDQIRGILIQDRVFHELIELNKKK